VLKPNNLSVAVCAKVHRAWLDQQTQGLHHRSPAAKPTFGEKTMQKPPGQTERLGFAMLASEIIWHPRSAFERADHGIWQARTGADWLAVVIQTRRQIALNTVINDPVIASVGVNPYPGLELAKMFCVAAAIIALAGANSAMAGRDSQGGGEQGDNF